MASRDVLIIVPTLGERRDLLRISVASLIAQTLPARVLVVTGADPEGLRGLWPEAAPVRVIAQEGRGLSAAINQAWARDGWSSELTGWLGDDDALPPWSIAAAVQALERRPAAVAVHGPCVVVDHHGSPSEVYRNGRWASVLAGYGVNLLPQPGALFRTTAVERLGGLDPDLRLAMDVDLFARLRTLGPLTHSRQQLGVFREHASGLSTDQATAARAEARRSAKALHTRPWQRAADVAALPLTRAVAAVNRLRPPPPSRYWCPPTA